MNLTEAERFISLFNNELSSSEIANVLNISPSNAYRKYLFLRVNGSEEFIDYFVNGNAPRYTSLEKANIVEFLIANDLKETFKN